MVAQASASGDPLIFVSDAAYPPFAHLDASGEIAGLERDLADALCAALERPCTFLLVPWAELGPTVIRGDADAAFAGLSRITATEIGLAPGEAYLATPSRFVALRGERQPSGTDDLANFVVGALWGTPHAHWLEQNLPAENVRRYPDPEELYLSLHAGTVDLVFNDGLTLYFDFLRSPLGADAVLVDLAIPLETDGEGYAFATKPDGETGAMLDAAMEQLVRDGTLTRLITAHLPGYSN